MDKVIAFIALLCAAWSSIAISGPLEYQCAIKSIHDLSDEGLMRESGWDSKMSGGHFTVTRSTGEILGETLTTIMARGTRIVNPGSSENSFKATADFDGQIQLIEIQEFKEGNLKPFVALSMGGAGIVTGVCR